MIVIAVLAILMIASCEELMRALGVVILVIALACMGGC